MTQTMRSERTAFVFTNTHEDARVCVCVRTHVCWRDGEVGEEPGVFCARVRHLHDTFTWTRREKSHHRKPRQDAGRRGNGSLFWLLTKAEQVYVFLIVVAVSSLPPVQGLLPG